MASILDLREKLANYQDDDDMHVSMVSHLRHLYAIRLMKNSNIADVNPTLTMQYGLKHNAAWAKSEQLTKDYMELNHHSLMAWNAHHYAKLINRSIDHMQKFTSPWYAYTFMKPSMRNSIMLTLEKFITALSEHGNMNGMVDTELFTELEITESMLQGLYYTYSNINRNRFEDVSNVQEYCLPINPEIYSALLGMKDRFKIDEIPDFDSKAVPRVNGLIHSIGTVMNIATMLVTFVGLSTWRMPSNMRDIDDLYNFCMKKSSAGMGYERVMSMVRHISNSNQISPEVALTLIDTPAYLPKRDMMIPIYGDTDTERYVVLDYFERESYARDTRNSRCESHAPIAVTATSSN